MTDMELLELAAKAAGNGAQWDCSERGMMILTPSGNDTMTWNPLTDDGDALRLAVKLQLLVNTDATESQATDGKNADECESHQGSNSYAATRRAIVRAAAEIGKETK